MIATAGLILTEYKIAIDPVDNESKNVFDAAGYKTIRLNEFDITMIK